MKFSIEQNELQYQISVAHFVVGEDYSEAIHGHNMGVRIVVFGSLNPRTKMVIDFLKLTPIVEKILDQWDHRTLVPSKSPDHRGKFYSIPANDIVLLPIENVTVEELARLLVEEIAQKLLALDEIKRAGNIEKIMVTISEYPWQTATAHFHLKE
ncbi:MAG: 6-pyruvoyl trahydropterin synthase family protein [Candidatus Hodarchaeales archaeon]|jgi:6-pyruvoyl-tetrahydropterin synthase